MSTPRRPPSLTLIVGELDRTGFVRKYNELWSKRTGLPICWIEAAAHNSNADNPAAVNAIIEEALGGNWRLHPADCGGFRHSRPPRSLQMIGRRCSALALPASNDRVRDALAGLILLECFR